MNVLSYLTHEEKLVALSIGETHVSIARFTRKEKTLEHSLRARIGIPKGTIIAGRVLDQKSLESALTQLRKKFGGSRYCVVTLPHLAIFNQVYSLPDTIAPEKITEAARLAESWRVPFPAEDAHIDSEIFYARYAAGKGRQTRIATQAITHRDAAPYFTALENTGFIPVAAESELVALARTLKDSTTQTITALPHESSTDIAVFDGAGLIFARSFKNEVLTKKELEAEQKRIIDYVEALHGKAPTKRTPAKLSLHDELRELIATDEALAEDTVAWLPVLGALLRARTPRSEDTFNSIYPMGTEEIYEYQKFFAFTGLMGTLTILASLIFLGAFTGMQYAADTLLKSGMVSEEAALMSTVRTQIAEKETSFSQANAIISIAGTLAGSEALWSKHIALLRRMQIDGIAVTKVEVSDDGKILLVGTARSRAHLNAYRDGLAALPEIAEASVPVTGAELRADIPFSMTITFTNVGASYRSGVIPTI